MRKWIIGEQSGNVFEAVFEPKSMGDCLALIADYLYFKSELERVFREMNAPSEAWSYLNKMCFYAQEFMPDEAFEERERQKEAEAAGES